MPVSIAVERKFDRTSKKAEGEMLIEEFSLTLLVRFRSCKAAGLSQTIGSSHCRGQIWKLENESSCYTIFGTVSTNGSC